MTQNYKILEELNADIEGENDIDAMDKVYAKMLGNKALVNTFVTHRTKFTRHWMHATTAGTTGVITLMASNKTISKPNIHIINLHQLNIATVVTRLSDGLVHTTVIR